MILQMYYVKRDKIEKVFEQFLEIPTKVLPKLKIAHIIGKAVQGQKGDIRDVISIGKLVRKNDGPEEVGQILSTMNKYGGKNEH